MTGRAAFLTPAEQIGQRLSREAIWHEGRCNWVGAMPEEGAAGKVVMSHAALGSDLYGGTSGVALFLAQLHVATGDTAARRTALGAIRHALSRVDDLPPENSLGLYGGR